MKSLSLHADMDSTYLRLLLGEIVGMNNEIVEQVCDHFETIGNNEPLIITNSNVADINTIENNIKTFIALFDIRGITTTVNDGIQPIVQLLPTTDTRVRFSESQIATNAVREGMTVQVWSSREYFATKHGNGNDPRSCIYWKNSKVC